PLQLISKFMKIKIGVCAGIFIAGSYACLVFGTLMFPFRNWDWVKSRCPDIVIVKCSETPIPRAIRYDPLVEANVETISVLKGSAKPGPFKIVINQDHWPCQNEYYLIFGFGSTDTIEAAESYATVPLGFSFSTNDLTGKTFDEQIEYMLKLRLDQ